MHAKKTWIIVKEMPATIDAKLAHKRSQMYYTEGADEDFFKKWAKWDLDKGIIEEIYFKKDKKDWYCLFDTKNTSMKVPIALLYFDFDIDGAFITDHPEPLKWAKSGTRIPQNDGKPLVIDWGDCKNNTDSAESASDTSDDKYYQNMIENNYCNDANVNVNLPPYLNDNLDAVSVEQNEENANEKSDNSFEDEDNVLTSETDSDYYNEHGLNHDVSVVE